MMVLLICFVYLLLLLFQIWWSTDLKSNEQDKYANDNLNLSDRGVNIDSNNNKNYNNEIDHEKNYLA